jgi:hypothetical protein
MPLLNKPYAPFDRDLDDAGQRERNERAKLMEARSRYYYGEHKPPLALKDADSSVVLNLCAEVIDKLTAAIGVPEWEFEESNAEPLADGSFAQEVSASEQRLEALLKRVSFNKLVPQLVETGLIAGHVYVRVVPGPKPHAVLLDPRMVTVFWSEDAKAGELPAAVYRLEWESMGLRRRQDIVRQPDGGWAIMEWVKGESGWGSAAVEVWPWEFAPIIDWQSGPRAFTYYGEPDLAQQAIRLNDAVNFVASNTGKILKFHASPKTIVAGGRLPDEIDVSPDAAIEFSSPDAKVWNLEMASDLTASMRFLDLLRASFFTERHVVDISTIKDRLGQLTNFSTRMLYADMLNLVDKRRDAHGAGLARLIAALMQLDGGTDELPAPRWPEALVADRAGLVATLEREMAMGVVSRQTAAAELGRDWLTESERMAEEGAAETEAQTETLTTLAQIGQV